MQPKIRNYYLPHTQTESLRLDTEQEDTNKHGVWWEGSGGGGGGGGKVTQFSTILFFY